MQTQTNIAPTQPLAGLRADHVMISTDDYAGTLEWYQEMLGFSVQLEWTVPEFPGVKLAYLALGEFLIEVVETPTAFQSKATPEDLATALQDRGFGHLAFSVTDVDAAADSLSRRGVHFVLPPTSFPDVARRVTFFRDNNGNLLELVMPMAEGA